MSDHDNGPGFVQPPMPAPPDETPRSWRRLSARMIIVRPLHEIVGSFPFLALLLITDNAGLWRVLAVGYLIGLVLVRGVVHWWRTSYRIDAEQVEVRTGLFVRKHLAVRRDRIRTVAVTVKWGHRLFGLTRLDIGTGREDPVSLDGIPSDRAERLREDLLGPTADTPGSIETAAARGAGTTPGGPNTPQTLRTLQPTWLRYAPLTLSGLASGGAVVGIAFRALDTTDTNPTDIGVLHDLGTWVQHSPPAVITAIAFGCVLAVVVLLSLANYAVQFWNYRLWQAGDGSLGVRRGLFTSRSLSISRERLRGVLRSEQLLLRAGGGSRLTAIVTGLGGQENSRSGLLLPPAPRTVANHTAAQCLGEPRSPVGTVLTRHPTRAAWRRQSRAVVPMLLIAVALAGCAVWAGAGWPDWPWITVVALTPAASLLALDRYRNLGHALTPHYLVTRSGSLRRDTAALQRTGIIGWKLRCSLFQRLAGLSTLTATTAAGDGAYEVTDVGHADAVALADSAVPDLLEPFLLTATDPATETHPRNQDTPSAPSSKFSV